MTYKFENLEIWHRAMEFSDSAYLIGNQLPRFEDNNLKSQMVRAATSVALNIAEGSTGQTDQEFSRFLGFSLRSLLETVACLRLIVRRGYNIEAQTVNKMDQQGEILFAKLQALRRKLNPGRTWVRESEAVE